MRGLRLRGFHPHPSPLPSRERGLMVGVVLLLPRPVDTALKPV